MKTLQGRKTGCEKCHELEARIAALESELAKLRKNSTNSSKPPSSDITKPADAKAAKVRGGKKRKRGGQPGHPRHTRPEFPPEQVNATWDYFYDGCPCCGGTLRERPQEEDIVQQQVDVQPVPIRVEEHRRRGQYCATCDKTYYCPLPEELARAGLAGPRSTALVGYLKSACHMSFSNIRKFLRDVVGVTLSRGYLRKIVAKVANSVEIPYDELLNQLPHEDILNVDETGHKENGERLWTWCFRAALYTVFKISPSRGSDVLIEVLGKEFDGILGADYFSAYRKFMGDFDVLIQFCLAHLIRDVKFLKEHPNRKNQVYGERLLEHLRKLFGVIHRRDKFASEASFRKQLATIRNDFLYAAIMTPPDTTEAGNMADRFVKHGEAYFQFITTPGIDPTNNLAEQAIRFVAIHRRMTQGTRSPQGRTWCERIWTVVVTCDQQGRSIFEYLCEAVKNHFQGNPAPSLIPAMNSS